MTTIADYVTLVENQIGIPYVFGGTELRGSPNPGVDCSGLVYACALALGQSIPRTSEAQWAGMQRISVTQARSGDLVFFDVPTDDQSQPAHVAMVYGFIGQMIQAPHTGADVETSPYANSMSWGSVMGYCRSPFPNATPAPLPQPKGNKMFDGSPDGSGYVILHSDGSVWNYGSWGGQYHGGLNPGAPVGGGAMPTGAVAVSIKATDSCAGYWIESSDGSIYAFGNAQYHGHP